MGTLNVSDRRLGFTKSHSFVMNCLLTDRAWMCELITKSGAKNAFFNVILPKVSCLSRCLIKLVTLVLSVGPKCSTEFECCALHVYSAPAGVRHQSGKVSNREKSPSFGFCQVDMYMYASS